MAPPIAGPPLVPYAATSAERGNAERLARLLVPLLPDIAASVPYAAISAERGNEGKETRRDLSPRTRSDA